MLSFMTQEIVRVRRAVINDHGDEVFDSDLSRADRLSLSGWSVQPGATVADATNRQGTSIALTAIGPAGVDVQAGDLIEAPGYPQLFEIDGEPQRWPSPTGALENTVLLLKRWVG